MSSNGSRPEVTPEADAFLREPRVAVLATIGADGAPRAVPVWFLWDGSAPILFTARTTRKWRNIQANPRVSLCIDHRPEPRSPGAEAYAAVMIDGHVEEATDRSLYDDVLAMSLAYWGEERGRPFAEAYHDRPDVVLFRIVPDRIVHQA